MSYHDTSYTRRTIPRTERWEGNNARRGGGGLAGEEDSGRMGPRMKKPPRRPRLRKITSKEVLLEPEERRLEVIGGVAEEKAAPDFIHGFVQANMVLALGRRDGQSGPRGPSGWWIGAEVDIEFSPNDLVRPDLAGWRQERFSQPPRTRPVKLSPDWICEIISQSNRKRDVVEKHNLYHRFGISHYWQLDPESQTLTVLGHEPDGYKVLLVASGMQPIRAAPFEQFEFTVEELLGEDPPG